jgi:hypothetical protein
MHAPAFDSEFTPELSPHEMLVLGVFGGAYFPDFKEMTTEFPKDWFEKAKLCSEKHDPKLNFFKRGDSPPLIKVLNNIIEL